MGTVTNSPALFAINSHFDKAGDWVNTGEPDGLQLEAKDSGIEVVSGYRSEGYAIDLSFSEAHQLALWLLAAVESRGES